MSDEKETKSPPALEPLTADQRLELARTQHQMSRFKGVAPDNPLNEMVAFAETICGAKFITEAARNDLPSIVLLLATCDDLGLKRTHGLRSLYMTPNGKIGMEGNLMLALLLAKKFQIKITESTPQAATYWIKRPKSEGEDAFEFSVQITLEQAKVNGWYTTDENGVPKKPVWRDSANMLRWRSLAFTARIVAADVLGGIYLIEELQEIEMQRGPDGAYSQRETADAEADRKAEADPGYSVEVVAAPEAAKATAEVVKAADPKPNGLSPQEARNESFLAEQARKRAAATERAKQQAPASTTTDNPTEHGVTMADVPKANGEVPQDKPAEDLRAVLKARVGVIVNQCNEHQGSFKLGTKVGLAMMSIYAGAFLGGTEKAKVASAWAEPLEALEAHLSEWKEQGYKELAENPDKLGKQLRKEQEAGETKGKKRQKKDELPEITKAFPEWGAEERALVSACIKNWAMRGDQDFVNRFSNFRPIPTGIDLRSALTLFSVTLDAGWLYKTALNVGKPMTQAVGLLEMMLTEPLTPEANREKVAEALKVTIQELEAPAQDDLFGDLKGEYPG